MPVSDNSDSDDDLWFLPGPPEDMAPTDPPWPVELRGPQFDVTEWGRAETVLGQQLAVAAASIARLDERLHWGPKGLCERLALMEVADQLWAQGDWVAPEKLALYRSLRLSTVQNARVLSQADWALRRLMSFRGPENGLARFLGRHEAERDGLAEVGKRPFGKDFERLEKHWNALQDESVHLHFLTRAAVGFFSWRLLGLSEPGAVLEPMAAVSSTTKEAGFLELSFLPVALGDKYLFGQNGKAEKLLRLWFVAIDNACKRALLHLDRLTDWSNRAGLKTNDLSGRTPPILLEALLQYPLVSVEMVVNSTSVSKVSAQRNLALLQGRGLVREVTGQARYRFWTAAV